MSYIVYASSDSALLAGCRKKDRKAREELYKKYAAQFYSLCRRYISNVMDSEDVLSTGFIKIFEQIHQFKGDGSFEGWMRRIIINEALAFLRKNKKNFQVSLPEDLIYTDGKIHVDEIDAEYLYNLIETLPLGYRTVFNLYVMDGFSHQQIAKKLGISTGTSKSQLKKARIWLQKSIPATYVQTQSHYYEKSY